MAYANQMAVAYNGYNGVVNVSGGASLYPTHANSGSVKVDQIKPIILGQINSFLLDASAAGKGTLDLSVGPPNKTLPHEIKNIGTQLFLIEFTPTEPVDHEVSIQFNETHIPGSPLIIPYYSNNVTSVAGSPFVLKAPYMDISSVIVSGEGLVLAKVHDQAVFNINATRLPSTIQPTVQVHGPQGSVQANVIATDLGQYRVAWIPSHAGDYEIKVTMAGQEVPRSPFRVKVADPKQVKVDCPPFANLGNTANVKVDVSRAGIGKLVVIISVDGSYVPNTVHQEGPSLYRFSFKPNVAKTHEVSVQFNGENVHGSPFTCAVTGGSRNVSLTSKQLTHYFGNPVEVEIDARSAGEGQIVAEVSSLNGGVPSDLVATSTKKIYLLSFLPKEGGEHTVTVTFNEEPVPQSPLKIHVQGGPSHSQNPMQFGTLCNAVVYQGSNIQRTEMLVYQQTPSHPLPPPQHHLKESMYSTQQEVLPASPHAVREYSLYNGQHSPAAMQSYDQHTTTLQELTRTITYQPQYESAMANESTYFEINPHGLSQKDLDVKVEDPYRKAVPLKVTQHGGKLRYEFTPRNTGKYHVYVEVDGAELPGSPFIYFVQPSSGVIIKDVTEEGYVGEEMYFIVDASEAGSGDLDVEVSCNGQLVRIKREPLGQSQYRYTYVPKQGGEHLIDVQYNYERVPGCPIQTHVSEMYHSTIERTPSVSSSYGVQGVSGRGIQSIPVSQQAYFFIDMHGRNWKLSDVEVHVRAPSGQSVPCKLFLESSNEIRVEYQTPYVGRHLVDIYCKGVKVSGSPYSVEVFDPKKVGMESMAKESYLHEETEFEVINDEAGSADIECRVISPSGRVIPSHVLHTDRGMKVKYTPGEPGLYYVHTYIGGVEIPGSPMTQMVRAHTLGSRHSRTSVHEYRERRDSGRYQSSDDGYGKLTVSGDGLYRAEEDKPAYFYIDTHGMEGTPEVRVEGPHSVAKCSVSPEGAYRYKVTYIPVETGIYDVYIRWYNQEIDGSPFHPRVVDARKVRFKGDWQSKVDAEQRVSMETGKMKRLMFDVTEAGPGELKAEVRHVGSGRLLPVTVTEKDVYHYYVDFVPDQPGDYLISINWTGTPIPNTPIRAYAMDHIAKSSGEASGQTSAGQSGGGKSGKEFSSTTTKKVTKSAGASSVSDHSKVVLSGTGLKEGIAGELAEFYIDGSKAADGEPTVILKNSRLQIVPVEVMRHGVKCYRCTYMVNEPGSYLLFVSWGDRDLLNSPYTVQIRDSLDVVDAAASNGHSSSYSSQQHHQRGQSIPIHHQQNGSSSQQQSSAGQQQSSGGQTGMSKHFVRKAKMTTSSNNQHHLQNVGEDFQLMIDANMMSGGELVARCLGPTMSAKCELVQKEGGMYALNVRPQESGEHNLSVTYKGEHIEGSPFLFSVKGSSPPDPTKVKVHGPGVEHGILADFESKFFVDTEGAGAGNLSVKMRGPKGGFQATMKRVSQTSRTIECNYSPAEVGLYVIHVKWSDVDVPGSPFHIHIFDTHYELDRFVQTGELPTTLREHHVLQIREPTQSYQASAYQTNTLKTLKKSKKSKKNKKNGYLNGEPVTLVQAPVQAVQPIQYVMKEPQYRPAPQFVRVKEADDVNYVKANTGRPVQVVNSGGGSSGYRHYRESHYAGGGSGGRYVERYGPGSKPKYVVAENGPQYVVRR